MSEFQWTAQDKKWIMFLVIALSIFLVLQLFLLLWNLMAFLGGILLMFFLAWLLAFVLNPVADWLCRYLGFNRFIAVTVIYLVLALVLVLIGLWIVPIIAFQLTQLVQASPDQLQKMVNYAQDWLNKRNLQVDLSSVNQSIVNQIQPLGGALINNLWNIANVTINIIINISVILILAFYIMIDGENIRRYLHRLLPTRYRDEAQLIERSIGRSFGGFIRGQIIIGVLYGIISAIVLWVLGVNYPFVLASTGGILMMIPFFGIFLSLIGPVIVAAFVSPWLALLVLGILFAIQQVIVNVILPKVMSESVGIHPLVVFFALFVGFRVAGVWGALFGIPVAGVINAIFQYFFDKYVKNGGATAPKRASRNSQCQ